MNQLFPTLAKQNVKFKGFYVAFLLLALVIATLSVFSTVLTGEMGQAAINMDTAGLIRFLVWMTVIMVIRAIASGASALFVGRFTAKTDYSFRENFAKYFLQKPFSAINDVNSGESLSVFTNDLPGAARLVANGGIRMFADIIALLVSFVYMFVINWWLTLIFIASFPLLIVVQVVISGPIQKKSAITLEKRAASNAVATDVFQNANVAVAYSLEHKMTERYYKAVTEVVKANMSEGRSFLFLVLAGIVASATPMFAVIGFSANQVIQGSMPMNEWLAYLILAQTAGSWLAMLSQRQNDVQAAAAAAKRLNETMIQEVEDINQGDILNTQHNMQTVLTFDNVSFAYNKDEDTKAVLNNISFDIKQGEKVAFVGSSGSGKSTVLKLMLGLYQPDNGSIHLFEENTASLSLKSRRAAFAYVPQDSFLFPESILENITGSTQYVKPQLEKALTDAGINEFVHALPGGVHEVLVESGDNVSGGQKQRIALARAFYADSPIILFDEATSALDPMTEKAVLSSFDHLSQNKTLIMVAHRANVIDTCDRIIVMDEGNIVGVGTHDELMAGNRVYRHLYQTTSNNNQALSTTNKEV